MKKEGLNKFRIVSFLKMSVL